MPIKNNKNSRTPEAESALKELFVDELKDIYWAEKHLATALPKMIKGATSEELKQTITTWKKPRTRSPAWKAYSLR